MKTWATTLALLAILGALTSHGRVRYLSTTGLDAPDAGATVGTAWRTFAFALAQLQPGDVLMVEPGTWTWTDGGVLDANCTSNTQSGLPDAGITVRASVERQAHIVSNGANAAAAVANCRYWTLEGLFLEGGDFVGGRSTLWVQDSQYVTMRRMLVSKDNRLENTKTIDVAVSSDVLVEECEVYDFFRVGIEVWHSPRVVVRRCYANSRGRPALDGGYTRVLADRADQSYANDSADLLIENSVSEGSRAGFHFFTEGSSDDGRYLGDISMRDMSGLMFQSGRPGEYGEHNVARDFLAFRNLDRGIEWRDNRDARCDGCTIYFPQRDGLFAAKDYGASTQLSVFATRTVVTAVDGGNGVSITGHSTFDLSDVNVFGFSTPFVPTDAGPRTSMADPLLGKCPMMIPESSPMKRAAADGGDIGANILYRYQDGVLTSEPLWRPGFPCGAIVAGVNDLPDASCFDLHTRLGVGDCAFAPGYLPLDGGQRFTSTPDRDAVCGRPWHYTPSVMGAGAPFTLEGAVPAGITVDSMTGTVDWVPLRDAGEVRFVLTARGPQNAVTQDLELTVTCTPARADVTCGCGATSGALVALALLALHRRAHQRRP